VNKLAIVAVACTMIAGSAAAAPFGMTEPGSRPLVLQTNGHDHGGGGWGGPNVFVDVPWSAVSGSGANNNSAPPPNSGYNHCREARHICFDRWGVDGFRYGRCMADQGC
jgi:hypothetical protein